MAQEDEYPDTDNSEIERIFSDHQLSLSIQEISLARSKASKLKLCAQHLREFYPDSWDLEMVARVVNGEQIPKATDYRNLSIKMRVEALMESDQLSQEKAVQKVADRIYLSTDAVRKAIRLANKGN